MPMEAGWSIPPSLAIHNTTYSKNTFSLPLTILTSHDAVLLYGLSYVNLWLAWDLHYRRLYHSFYWLDLTYIRPDFARISVRSDNLSSKQTSFLNEEKALVGTSG